jgi:hypothetical protein
MLPLNVPVVLAVAVSGLLVSAVAQPADKTFDEKGLTLRVVARSVAVPTSAGTSLHWVASSLSSSVIQVTNPQMRQRLADALTVLEKGDQNCPAFVWDLFNECTAQERLKALLKEFSFAVKDATALVDPPENAVATADVILNVTYTIAAARVIESVSIEVATAKSAAAGAAGAVESTLSSELAAALVGAAAPAAALKTVPITVRVADADRDRPDPALPRFDIARLQTELFRVGLGVLELAAKRNVVPGIRPPPDDDLTALDTVDLVEVYSLERPRWRPPPARSQHDGTKYTVALRGVRFVSAVNADVVRGKLVGENGPRDFVGATANGERELADILKTSTRRATAVLQSSPANLEGTVPTRAGVLRLFDALRTVAKIGPPYDITAADDGTMTFQATQRWVDSEIEAKFNLGVNLDPQQQFTGSGKLRQYNVAHLPFSKSAEGLHETWELNINGGEEAQKARFDLTVPREWGKGNILAAGANFAMFFSRDSNQRFGNLPAPGAPDVKLIDQERGFAPKVYLTHETGRPWLNRLRWEGSWDWRHILIHPREGALPSLADGMLSSLDTMVSNEILRDFTPTVPAGKPPGGGIGETSLRVEAAVRRARWDPDNWFWRPTLLGSADAIFGWSTRKELLVRETWSAGWSCAEAPFFQLQRLGGPRSVRGIEEGERIGRAARALQTTAGVGLPVFWPALLKLEGPAAALAGSYLTFFYDRAYVATGQVRYAANGFGAAIEIRNLPAGKMRAHISIGWAFSPQSALHDKGVMTLDARISK